MRGAEEGTGFQGQLGILSPETGGFSSPNGAACQPPGAQVTPWPHDQPHVITLQSPARGNGLSG